MWDDAIEYGFIVDDYCVNEVYDGESHFYIDGNTENSGYVLVLMYDTNNMKFYEVTENCNEELN